MPRHHGGDGEGRGVLVIEASGRSQGSILIQNHVFSQHAAVDGPADRIDVRLARKRTGAPLRQKHGRYAVPELEPVKTGSDANYEVDGIGNRRYGTCRLPAPIPLITMRSR
ncbi:hypothetical protein [Arthrobacter sp. CAN_C5]|uniref:hypothetical protein n=1 Tax=Arthrobacter sp. CAN_C5 TaxID=2760706 RepID=UPI001AE7D88D|nr:hypothetical protein [Arthrobacter sp. CAN_C5]MBP2217077.1 hypothetical protein [Arthrobacter sp. CAN_C5]